MIDMYREEFEDRCEGYMVMPNGEHLPTLEPPNKDNQRNISCIPYGQYRVKRNTTGRFQYYGIENVPNRSNIEIHKGTLPSHSDGCILLLTNEDLSVLMDWFGDDDWYLDIRSMDDVTL